MLAVAEPLEPASARLMAFLGVKVVVSPAGARVDRETVAAIERLERREIPHCHQECRRTRGLCGKCEVSAAKPYGKFDGPAFQAQDYRASLASIARRRQDGQEVRGCPSCGTEIDVVTPAHAPRCSASVRVPVGGGV